MRSLWFGVAVSAMGLVPVQFAASPGWYAGAAPTRSCPGVSPSRCSESWTWTATVPWKDCGDCVAQKTLMRMPADGIAIAVARMRERPLRATDQIRWPPTIAAGETNGMDGIPLRYGVYQLFGRVGAGYEVRLIVYFGRRTPSALQLARANARLRVLRL